MIIGHGFPPEQGNSSNCKPPEAKSKSRRHKTIVDTSPPGEQHPVTSILLLSYTCGNSQEAEGVPLDGHFVIYPRHCFVSLSHGWCGRSCHLREPELLASRMGKPSQQGEDQVGYLP